MMRSPLTRADLKRFFGGGEPGTGGKRLIGIDAARGVALFALIAVHILSTENDETGEPTLVWELFGGNSAALFALLAGVGLALSSGGRTVHTGQRLMGDRLGLAVRAVLIGIVALLTAALLPEDPPEAGILLYYSVFFLLAIPFLRLGPRGLFLSAAMFGLFAPLLMQQLEPLLPEWSAVNPTVGELFSEPAAVASQLLLTGTYPALPYMCYVLAGIGIGRLDLRQTRAAVWIAGTGAALTIIANGASALLLHAAGYDRLLETPGMTPEVLDDAIAFGPEVVPDTSLWWLALDAGHTNMPLALADSLGVSLLVMGVLLLLGRRFGRALAPLAIAGSMTLTLYTAHLLVLGTEVHASAPVVWFIVHCAAALMFAAHWQRRAGQGPLEKPVAAIVRRVRKLVDPPAPGDPADPWTRREATSR